MRHLDVEVRAAGRSVEDVYAVLCDFECYPAHAPAVKSVRVTSSSNDGVLSSWEVMFRTGILRWTERDTFDPSTRTITFRQTEGDIEYFAGEWHVDEGADGATVVRFAADFDLGIPALSGLLEPIAERALRDNVQQIVAGLVASMGKLDGTQVGMGADAVPSS